MTAVPSPRDLNRAGGPAGGGETQHDGAVDAALETLSKSTEEFVDGAREDAGGVIEAAESMGASTSQIVWKVLLPEARPSLLVGGAIAITTILSYSAMAGFIGGGGLGDIAIRYGYYRYQSTIMFITSAILVVIVQVLQAAGMKLARIGDKRIS